MRWEKTQAAYLAAVREAARHPDLPTQEEQDRQAAEKRDRRNAIYARRANSPAWQAREKAWKEWRERHPLVHAAPASKTPAWMGDEAEEQKKVESVEAENRRSGLHFSPKPMRSWETRDVWKSALREAERQASQEGEEQ